MTQGVRLSESQEFSIVCSGGDGFLQSLWGSLKRNPLSCTRQDLNPGPLANHARVLPTELSWLLSHLRAYMRIYIYIHTHVCIYIYIYMHIYIYIYMCMYNAQMTDIHIHVHTCIYIYIYMCIYLCMYICIYTYIYIYIYTYIPCCKMLCYGT